MPGGADLNDLVLAAAAAPADLIAGHTELARRARAADLAVYANTLGPFAGVIYPGAQVAAALTVRREVNAWLRGTDVFDAVRGREAPQRRGRSRDG